MAKTKIRKELITDDIDGSELPDGKPTIRFSFDGINYDIDLSEKNEKALRDALAPFIKVASPRNQALNKMQGGKVKTENSANSERLAAIREWATSEGIEVSERGRIAASVQEQFDAAHAKA